MNFRKTTKATLSTVETLASTVESAATYAKSFIDHELVKQENIQKQELETGLYLKQALADDLVELKELVDSLPDDIAKQVMGA